MLRGSRLFVACSLALLGACGLTTRNADDTGSGGAGAQGGTASSGGTGASGGTAASPGAGGSGAGASGGTGGSGGSLGGLGGDAGAPSCVSDECFCESLHGCTPAEHREWFGLGSLGWRTCGEIDERKCLVTSFFEEERGLVKARCEVPRPCESCGIETICEDAGSEWAHPTSEYCEVVASCTLGLDCPADALDDPLDCDAPTCNAIDPLSFGTCEKLLGYGFDSTGCVAVSGCDCEPHCDAIYETREACWEACNRSCDDIDRERERFIAETAWCRTADDCVWASSAAPPFDHCSCVVALNTSRLNRWQQLNEEYGCYEPLGCCPAIPPPLDCVDGQCVPE